MSKLFQAFFTGMFITFFLDFFLFLGIKLHYIDFYEIDVYYNILFADHQKAVIFFPLSIALGYLVVYTNNTKVNLLIIGSLSVLTFSTLIPSIGYKVGKMFLMKEKITLQDTRHKYYGDIYYNARSTITFYDYELKKIILLQKKDLKI